MADVSLSGSIVQSSQDVPTRSGQRVETESEIANIGTPYRGMIIYIVDQDSYVYVKTLKSKKIGRFEIENALVDEYEPLVSKTNEEINLNWNEVL